MTIVGTAAWSLPKTSAHRFPSEGSSLARYAAVFDGVEVNSSFYRRHKPETWKRWAETVPAHFRFAVKVPKQITHEKRLVDAEAECDAFIADISLLGTRLGPVLLQLPPSLPYHEDNVRSFFGHLRSIFRGRLVLEPRHKSWATEEASSLLSPYSVSRVVADPAPIPQENAPDFLYLRLHGSPKIYYSNYEPEDLARYADMLRQAPDDSWCIFDNTASGAALVNALDMLDLLGKKKTHPRRADAFS
jgi:uncharacterized protein YecE (DUF72 family)